MTKLLAFSWGYKGWGSSTRQLKRAIDTVEAARGYGPPYFVDIRMVRSGRAVGFQGNAFEHVTGRARYRWMQSLGNRTIVEKSRRRMKINKPEAVHDLLDLIVEKGPKQRVIFFCSCGTNPLCHRFKIRSLLLKEALRRGAKLTVAEWPGGTPSSKPVTLTDAIAKSVTPGRKRVPLGKRQPPVNLLGLPWSSLVHFESPKGKFKALADPARCEGGEWFLPTPYGIANGRITDQAMKKKSSRDRRSFRFEAVSTTRNAS